SFVSDRNKTMAIEALDEIDNAEGCPLSVVEDFMVHFHLDDDGTLQIEEFGEGTENTIWKDYPILDETLDRIFQETKGEPLTREDMQVIGEAVSKERERVKPKGVQQPETNLGQEIKKATDAPTRMIESEIKKKAMEKLKEFKPKGKPN
ncbi:MAG: hypothetical protein IH917_15645, partial [Acidobacteria bacterium]|nr:hypothetical protein [Acidobacteriota bacterium]